MRWTRGDRSSDIEDRRGAPGGMGMRVGGGVGIGGVVLHPQRLDAGIQVVGQHIVLRGAVQLLT